MRRTARSSRGWGVAVDGDPPHVQNRTLHLSPEPERKPRFLGSQPGCGESWRLRSRCCPCSLPEETGRLPGCAHLGSGEPAWPPSSSVQQEGQLPSKISDRKVSQPGMCTGIRERLGASLVICRERERESASKMLAQRVGPLLPSLYPVGGSMGVGASRRGYRRCSRPSVPEEGALPR